MQSNESHASDDLKRLRWQCRRGMKELDFLLIRFLDQSYSSASVSMQANFCALLELEDDRLWNWFLGRAKPENAELDAIVQCIRSTPSADS